MGESLYTPYISISASQRPLLDRFPSQTLIVPTTSFEHADQHDQSFFTRTRFHSTTSIKMQLIASVAALAATITSVNALGNAIVNNIYQDAAYRKRRGPRRNHHFCECSRQCHCQQHLSRCSLSQASRPSPQPSLL